MNFYFTEINWPLTATSSALNDVVGNSFIKNRERVLARSVLKTNSRENKLIMKRQETKR